MRKLLRGALLRKGVKTALKNIKRKNPELFGKAKTTFIKTKHLVKKDPLLPNITSKDFRNLGTAMAVDKQLLTQRKIALKRFKKEEKIRKLIKYPFPATKYKFYKYNSPKILHKLTKKLSILRPAKSQIEKYINKLQAKWSIKHNTGGEVVVGRNVDRSLL